jgi:thiamine biosynthesis protein ThiS
MKILLNGETVDAREVRTLADLVARFELPPSSIVIEHNGIALHRRDWPRQALVEGDRVEFVRVVAGG